jgi:hypothetical protein
MSREHQIREAIDRFLARTRQATDSHLEALSSELLAVVQGDMRTNRVDVERAAVDVARAVARGGAHARHDLMTRIVDAVRRLDEATSLRGILEALAWARLPRRRAPPSCSSTARRCVPTNTPGSRLDRRRRT